MDLAKMRVQMPESNPDDWFCRLAVVLVVLVVLVVISYFRRERERGLIIQVLVSQLLEWEIIAVV